MKRMNLSILLGIVLAAQTGCAPSVEIIAHRGASYLAPENTMASVMMGWEKEADVEVDVHLTQDDRIMVIHDSTTKRTTNQDLTVSETASEVLRQLDAGSFKGEFFAGEPIPFLADIIDTIPPQRKLYVEIKCGPEILPELRRILRDSGKISQIVIIGFDLDTVVESKILMPRIPTYWLKGTVKDKETDDWIPHDSQLVQIISDKGLDGLDVHYAGVNTEFMNAVKAAGQKLYVWTVDDPEQAKHLIALGVNGITTNRPEWLRKQLKN